MAVQFLGQLGGQRKASTGSAILGLANSISKFKQLTLQEELIKQKSISAKSTEAMREVQLELSKIKLGEVKDTAHARAIHSQLAEDEDKRLLANNKERHSLEKSLLQSRARVGEASATTAEAGVGAKVAEAGVRETKANLMQKHLNENADAQVEYMKKELEANNTMLETKIVLGQEAQRVAKRTKQDNSDKRNLASGEKAHQIFTNDSTTVEEKEAYRGVLKVENPEVYDLYKDFPLEGSTADQAKAQRKIVADVLEIRPDLAPFLYGIGTKGKAKELTDEQKNENTLAITQGNPPPHEVPISPAEEFSRILADIAQRKKVASKYTTLSKGLSFKTPSKRKKFEGYLRDIDLDKDIPRSVIDSLTEEQKEVIANHLRTSGYVDRQKVRVDRRIRERTNQAKYDSRSWYDKTIEGIQNLNRHDF